MDKELALAIDFKKAPKEVQDAANAHYANVKALAKAKKQSEAAAVAFAEAQRAHEATAKALRIALKAWEPEA